MHEKCLLCVKFIYKCACIVQSPYDKLDPQLLLDASFEIALPLGGYSTFTCGSVYSQASSTAPLQ